MIDQESLDKFIKKIDTMPESVKKEMREKLLKRLGLPLEAPVKKTPTQE